jgi:dihydrofolate reductase
MIFATESGPTVVSSVTCQISMSLDGFVAGPNQSSENPIGERGLRLHDWLFATASWRKQAGLEGGEDGVDSAVFSEGVEAAGAYIMGRKMFGGGAGEWNDSWRGWWGEEPPFHAPVFVLSHHQRAPLVMEGGTTFTFVTDGIKATLEQARAAAGDQSVAIAGGASVVQQYLTAELLDELHLHIVPVVLGSGERLLENVGDPRLEPINVIASPAVTHVKYRVRRPI